MDPIYDSGYSGLMKNRLLFCVVPIIAFGLFGTFAESRVSQPRALSASEHVLSQSGNHSSGSLDYAFTTIMNRLFGGLVMTAHAQQSDPEVQASIEYVNNLIEDCVFDHGYQCAEVAGDTFLEPASEAKRIPGRWLEAWPAALTALVTSQDLSTEQKLLRHYKIGFAEDETHYLILFDALSLPRIEDGKPAGLMSASIGKSMKIWVDKATLSVTDMKFLR